MDNHCDLKTTMQIKLSLTKKMFGTEIREVEERPLEPSPGCHRSMMLVEALGRKPNGPSSVSSHVPLLSVKLVINQMSSVHKGKKNPRYW